MTYGVKKQVQLIIDHFAQLGFICRIDYEAFALPGKSFSHIISFISGRTQAKSAIRFFRLVTVYFGENVRLSSHNTTRIALEDFREESYHVKGTCRLCGFSDAPLKESASKLWKEEDLCFDCFDPNQHGWNPKVNGSPVKEMV